MTTTNKNPKMNKTLSPVMSGRDAKDDGIVYQIEDPSGLAWLAQKALDAGEEDSWATEAVILSNDALDGSYQDRELYAVRFKAHASWGLKGQVVTSHGKFNLYFEFCRDAE